LLAIPGAAREAIVSEAKLSFFWDRKEDLGRFGHGGPNKMQIIMISL